MDNAFGVSFVDPDFSFQRKKLKPDLLGQYAHGTPATIAILVLSYIYGIWRLQKLGGPGVDEFIEGKSKPWRGQKKGF